MQMHEAVQHPGLRLQLQCPVHYRCRNQHLGRSAGVDMAAFAVRWRCYRRPLNGNGNWQIARDDDVTAPKHNGRPRWLFHLPARCHALRRHVKLPKAPADVASVDSSPCHMASFVNQRRSTRQMLRYITYSLWRYRIHVIRGTSLSSPGSTSRLVTLSFMNISITLWSKETAGKYS